MLRNLFLVLGALAVVSHAVADATYPDLVKATNQIVALRNERISQNPDAATDALEHACRATKEILNDKRFKDNLERLAKDSKKHSTELMQLKTDLQKFVFAFLAVEEETLQSESLLDEVITRMKIGASLFRDKVDRSRKPDEIIAAISQFSKEVCNGVNILKNKEESKRGGIVEKWKYAITGVIIIVVDIPLYLRKPGIAQASMNIGTGMIGWTDEDK